MPHAAKWFQSRAAIFLWKRLQPKLCFMWKVNIQVSLLRHEVGPSERKNGQDTKPIPPEMEAYTHFFQTKWNYFSFSYLYFSIFFSVCMHICMGVYVHLYVHVCEVCVHLCVQRSEARGGMLWEFFQPIAFGVPALWVWSEVLCMDW